MRYLVGFILLSLLLCASAYAVPVTGRKDRVAHIDSVRDSAGVMNYRIRCTDITARFRNGHWWQPDSVKFFSEMTKVEWASTILKKQVDTFTDSLQMLTDSAGKFIAQGKFTQGSLEETMRHLSDTLQRTVSTHSYSLRRLEDYQTVLTAARPLLSAARPN